MLYRPYLNILANSLELTFEMVEKLTQKSKIQNFPELHFHALGTWKIFGADCPVTHLATYVIQVALIFLDPKLNRKIPPPSCTMGTSPKLLDIRKTKALVESYKATVEDWADSDGLDYALDSEDGMCNIVPVMSMNG